MLICELLLICILRIWLIQIYEVSSTMATCEIDSFVKKFKLLRSAGYDTSLKIECKLGEVYVKLNCKVGTTIPPPSSPFTAKYRSPSYYRRQERRKATHDSANVAKVAEVFDSINEANVHIDLTVPVSAG